MEARGPWGSSYYMPTAACLAMGWFSALIRSPTTSSTLQNQHFASLERSSRSSPRDYYSLFFALKQPCRQHFLPEEQVTKANRSSRVLHETFNDRREATFERNHCHISFIQIIPMSQNAPFRYAWILILVLPYAPTGHQQRKTLYLN
jgi:hypothetical protein